MGACDFECWGHGKTPQEAFRAAVEDAQYEHGHGGYTGTIAEKGNFVCIDLPPRMTTATACKLWQLNQYSLDYAKQHIAQLKARNEPGNRDYAYRNACFDARHANPPRPEPSFAEWKAQYLKEARARLRKDTKLLKDHAALVAKIRSNADDKWGPAVCIEKKGKEAKEARDRGNYPRGTRFFLFFGSASS